MKFLFLFIPSIMLHGRKYWKEKPNIISAAPFEFQSHLLLSELLRLEMIWTNSFWFMVVCFQKLLLNFYLTFQSEFKSEPMKDFLVRALWVPVLWNWPSSWFSCNLELVMINLYLIVSRDPGKCFSEAHNKDFHIIYLIKFNVEFSLS